MSKILQDIYILTDSGTTIWSRVFNPKINEQMFGVVMSAINKFAEQISETGINYFQLSKKHYVILKKKGLLFIGNAEKDVKEKKIKNELTRISEKFFELYSNKLHQIKKFGEISLLSDFEKHIKHSLEDTIDKFEKAFW
jgi:hypothetical protein